MKIGSIIFWNLNFVMISGSQEGSGLISGQKGCKLLNFGRVSKTNLEDFEKYIS